MTDVLEGRLRDALREVSGDAPTDLAGLAEGARRRSRRRRTTATVVAAAAAVVALAVPATVLLRGDGAVAPDPGTPAASQSEQEWRTVEWRDISLQVPPSWIDGDRASWCLDIRGPEVPRVTTPDTPTPLVDVDCVQASLGVTIARTTDGREGVTRPQQLYPPVGEPPYWLPGSWRATWHYDDLLVEVNAADRETVERVLASIVVTSTLEEADVWIETEHEGVTLELPPDWQRVDTDGCANAWRQFGPPDDRCGGGLGVAFYASALFDPAIPLGVSRTEDGWIGLEYVGDWAIVVRADDRSTVERVLESAR